MNLGNAISLRQYLRTTQRLFFGFFYVGIGALGLNLYAQGIKFTGRNPGTKTPISSKHGGKHGSCVYNECYNERMLELATSPPQYHMGICRVIACERFRGRRKRVNFACAPQAHI